MATIPSQKHSRLPILILIASVASTQPTDREGSSQPRPAALHPASTHNGGKEENRQLSSPKLSAPPHHPSSFSPSSSASTAVSVVLEQYSCASMSRKGSTRASLAALRRIGTCAFVV